MSDFWAEFLDAELIFVADSYALYHLRPVLMAITFLIFIGGVTQMSILRVDVSTASGVVGSLLAALFLFPVIGLWIARGSKKRVVP